MTQIARLHPPLVDSPPGFDRHPLLQGSFSQVLRAGLQVRRVETGTTILSEGEVPTSVVFLLSGSVRAVLTAEDGRQALARLLRAPGLLGGLEASVGAPCSVSFSAMEITRVASLPAAEWQRALGQWPELRRRWLSLLAEEQRAILGQHRSVVFRDLEVRLAELVLNLLDAYGLPVAGGRRIRVRLRHEDLADFLGAARRSVTRILKDWRARGWMFHDGGSFTVSNPMALRELTAELMPPTPFRRPQNA